MEKAVRVAALGDDDAGEAGGSNVNFSLSSSFPVVNSARLVLRKRICDGDALPGARAPSRRGIRRPHVAARGFRILIWPRRRIEIIAPLTALTHCVRPVLTHLPRLLPLLASNEIRSHGHLPAPGRPHLRREVGAGTQARRSPTTSAPGPATRRLVFLAVHMASGARGPASEQFGVTHCGLGPGSHLRVWPPWASSCLTGGRLAGRAVRPHTVLVPWPGGSRSQAAGPFLRRLDKTVPSHVLRWGCQDHSDRLQH